MIWIGTSGWVYPHWVGRFYPRELSANEYLAYYTQHFPTVEINRSFYRLPTRDQFQNWSKQIQRPSQFLFAVKASRYITHMKKLLHPEEGLQRLYHAAEGLETHLGPILYQLPPHWQANISRLAAFIATLPPNHRTAFEFRDPSWYLPEQRQALLKLLNQTGCALVISIGGSSPTPTDIPATGPFLYLRFHNGKHGPAISDDELTYWAHYLSQTKTHDGEAFVYFNNDIDGHAIFDAFKLQNMLNSGATGQK